MKIQQFQFNPLQENTYAVYDATGECVIIDPGCLFPEEKKSLLDFIESHQLKVKHLINTHLHFDHIFGSKFLEEHFGLTTKAHPADEPLLDNLDDKMRMFGFPAGLLEPPRITEHIHEGDFILFGNQKLEVIEVPGHSPGHVVFYDANHNNLFAGDTLFRGSIGRTDLEGGNHQQLLDGIRTKLFTLPSSTVVYSGHGASTTIGQEKSSNPFF